MARRMLTDELWSKLKVILRQHRIYDKPFLRDMLKGMLLACEWGALGEIFRGIWVLEHDISKFNRWSAKNKLKIMFKMLVHEPDLERLSINRQNPPFNALRTSRRALQWRVLILAR